MGFEACATAELEEGHVKVAIFAEPKEDLFAHAALQLATGRWISKMGGHEDIMHTLV
jgi:hypothetical protein